MSLCCFLRMNGTFRLFTACFPGRTRDMLIRYRRSEDVQPVVSWAPAAGLGRAGSRRQGRLLGVAVVLVPLGAPGAAVVSRAQAQSCRTSPLPGLRRDWPATPSSVGCTPRPAEKRWPPARLGWRRTPEAGTAGGAGLKAPRRCSPFLPFIWLTEFFPLQGVNSGCYQ